MEGAERFVELISSQRIQERVQELGDQITHDLRGCDLVVVGVLKGAVMFMTDLVRCIELPLSMDFLGVSSYGDKTDTSGVVQITQDLTQPLVDKDVLVVEDIVDTGLTLAFLLDHLRVRLPRSIRVCTLLHKPSHTKKAVHLDYVGFVIDDKFVVGYGLDYEQRYRNLRYIGYLPMD